MHCEAYHTGSKYVFTAMKLQMMKTFLTNRCSYSTLRNAFNFHYKPASFFAVLYLSAQERRTISNEVTMFLFYI